MAATVYVSSISSLISQEQIQQLFEACGIIKSCVLSKGSDGKNSAVIEYTDPVHATAAVALSGTYLGDGMFTVSSQPPKPVAPSVAPGGIMPGMMLSGVVPSQPQQQVVPNVHMMQQQQQQAPTGGLSASAQSTQEALLAAQLKREEEISRTIYVGNLRPEISEDMLSDWLSKCGEVVCVKHCNNTVGEGENRVRYSFVEFKTREAAMTALGIGGSLLAGRPIKVGKALNPIIKNSKTLKKTAEVKKLPESSEIMQRVFQIKERLDRKLRLLDSGGGGGGGDKADGDGERSRSRSRDRRRRDRSRERAGGRRRRSRSRERRRRRRDE